MQPQPPAWLDWVFNHRWLALLAILVVCFLALWVTDDYGASSVWVYAAALGAIFFIGVGRGYKRLSRSPEFWGFFALWTLIHIAVFFTVLAYWGLLYYIPIALLELWVFY